MEMLTRPWPWYVAGPVIGATAPLLLLLGNRLFGISATLRHVCAAVYPRGLSYLSYDWRRGGGWNLAFAGGVLIGGFLAGTVFADPDPVMISSGAREALVNLGITDFRGLVPADLFSWEALTTPRGVIAVVVGGFLVGFGTSWAGGCTSGHGISGLADLQLPSLIAVASFFAGGILATHLLLPVIL